MVCQPLRLALMIGAITAVAVSPAQANFRASRGNACGDPCCGSSGTTAPAYRTITCTEWVRETYQTKRTAYKVECRTETYDTFKTECVPEVRERTVCVTKKVPVVKEEVRKVCHKVTVYEDRTVTRNTYKTVQETVMKKQLVRMGHWETCEVPALFNGFGGGLFGGHGHGNACADPCATNCNNNACNNSCNNACRTRTKKTWVHCPEYRECPVTVCKKICVPETVVCKVAVCKNEWREEKVKVCTYQCVQENRVEKCTVYVSRKVACKATRTVRVCVPYEETVTCCKMVPRTVTRQVPCAAPCAPASNACSSNGCSNASNACCETSNRCGLFSRMGGCFKGLRNNSDCCRTSCCN